MVLERNEVMGHRLIFGELLIGDRGGRNQLLEAYEKMRQASDVPHPEVVSFVRDRRLHGCGVGWIDVHLLASALVDRVPLWTTDSALLQIADDLGVAYQADASL